MKKWLIAAMTASCTLTLQAAPLSVTLNAVSADGIGAELGGLVDGGELGLLQGFQERGGLLGPKAGDDSAIDVGTQATEHLDLAPGVHVLSPNRTSW